MPPAFRNIAGGSAKDGDGSVGHGQARSLGEVAAADGQGGTRRFLTAALFLLAASPAPSATAEIEIEAGKSEASSGSRRAGGPASSLPLRSAARAARETLGCKECRVIFPGARAATASDPSFPTALVADVTMGGGEETGSNDEQRSSKCNTGSGGSNHTVRSGCDQEGGSGNTASGVDDDWWEKLRQAERGWTSSETAQEQGSASPSPNAGKAARETESWVGLHLKLRSSDVYGVEGRAAIVDFLKGRVNGKQIARREDEDEEQEEQEEEEEHVRGEENDRAGFSRETNPQETTEPTETTASPPMADVSTAGGEGAASGLPSSRIPREEATMRDAGWGQEKEGVHLLRKAARGEAAVAVAVLVFGSELSKRDRAGLHSQAEEAGGVASSSHGVGGGRFLILTCGLGSRAGAAELELSSEKVGALSGVCVRWRGYFNSTRVYVCVAFLM